MFHGPGRTEKSSGDPFEIDFFTEECGVKIQEKTRHLNPMKWIKSVGLGLHVGISGQAV